jgi:hypothetical protein
MSETERSGKRKRAERWTTAQARGVVARWRRSGQSAAGFAAQQHISASRLSYWSKQLRVDDPPQFVGVDVAAASGSVAHAVEIVVAGLTLRVNHGADAGFVVQLVAALQSRSRTPC